MSGTGSRPSWRLILSADRSAAENMALDEAIALSVRTGETRPALRLYGWTGPAVTIGCFQKTSDIDLAFCRKHDIHVVRRPTGGRAILHGHELTYSVAVRTDTAGFSSGLLDSYRRISHAFALALAKAGLAAEMKNQREKGSELTRYALCFASSSYGELLARGRKVVGSAQKRWTDALLQQGSIPYRNDSGLALRVFGIGSTNAPGIPEGLEGLIPGFDADAFRASVVSSFEESCGVTLTREAPAPAEEERARHLLAIKYLRDDWNLHR